MVGEGKVGSGYSIPIKFQLYKMSKFRDHAYSYRYYIVHLKICQKNMLSVLTTVKKSRAEKKLI